MRHELVWGTGTRCRCPSRESRIPVPRGATERKRNTRRRLSVVILGCSRISSEWSTIVRAVVALIVGGMIATISRDPCGTPQECCHLAYIDAAEGTEGCCSPTAHQPDGRRTPQPSGCGCTIDTDATLPKQDAEGLYAVGSWRHLLNGCATTPVPQWESLCLVPQSTLRARGSPSRTAAPSLASFSLPLRC